MLGLGSTDGTLALRKAWLVTSFFLWEEKGAQPSRILDFLRLPWAGGIGDFSKPAIDEAVQDSSFRLIAKESSPHSKNLQ